MEKTETQFQELITKEMTIGDVVNKYPFLANIMTDHGLHCIGCHANPYETIINGCLGHGMEPGEVDELVSKLNNAIKNQKEEKQLIITENAAAKFKEFMKADNKESFAVRLGVFESGRCCSGSQFTLDFADKLDDNEIIVNDNGINVYVDKEVVRTLNGLKIDFIEDKNGSGFKIDSNMEESSSCGSGC